MTKADELKLRLESNEIVAMYEIVINVLVKYSNTLYLADNFHTIFSPYILCRYLSMKNDLLPYAEYLSSVYSTAKLTNEEFYKLCYALIPKQKSSFIKYIKKNDKKKTKETNIVINNNNSKIANNLMEL